LEDLGISSFHGKNAEEGKFAGFLSAVQTVHVPAGTSLLVESLDRLSREQVTEALTQCLQIIRAGIVVVTPIEKMVCSLATINEKRPLACRTFRSACLIAEASNREPQSSPTV